jgi:hypothetical protein
MAGTAALMAPRKRPRRRLLRAVMRAGWWGRWRVGRESVVGLVVRAAEPATCPIAHRRARKHPPPAGGPGVS